MDNFKLKLHNSWGLGKPGGYEITINSDTSKHEMVNLVRTEIDIVNKTTLSEKTYKITSEEFDELLKLVKKMKLFRKFKSNLIFDVSYVVDVELDGKSSHIVNHTEIYDKLYDKLALFVGRRVL